MVVARRVRRRLCVGQAKILWKTLLCTHQVAFPDRRTDKCSMFVTWWRPVACRALSSSWETVVSTSRQCFARPQDRSWIRSTAGQHPHGFRPFPWFFKLRVSQEVRFFHRVQENTPTYMNDTHTYTSTDSHVCHLLEVSSGCHLSLLRTLRLLDVVHLFTMISGIHQTEGLMKNSKKKGSPHQVCDS